MSVEPRIAKLIEKQLRREISSEEEKELVAWINENPARRLWILEIYKQAGWDEMTADQGKEDVCHRAAPGEIRIDTWRRTATAVAACALAIVWLRLLYTPPDDYDFNPLPVGVAMTQPADHPHLILSDGEDILLDKLPVHGIIEEKEWKITKTGSHTVEVHISSNTAVSRNLPPAGYLTFTVPYGQSWQMTLPDNSSVQLAAGSTLSYKVSSPDHPSQQRLVSLQGQAFFKVAPDIHRPFAVKTKTGIVAALGTSFNVRDYAKEDDFRTTLVSGAIRVHCHGKYEILEPGQEIRIDAAKRDVCDVRQVDTTASLSWRSPYFNLTDMNLRQVMQQVKDWYGLQGYRCAGNVDTVSRGLLGGGRIAKDISLHTLLDSLQSLSRGSIRFRIEGTTTVISQIVQ